MDNTTIIEINGVKLEVDLRHAKKIEHLKVGDTVKILKKEYSDSYKSLPGVIVGFDAYEKLPTIIIAYVEERYSSDMIINMIYYNASSKDVEVIPANEHDLSFKKQDVLNWFAREITKKQEEIREIERRQAYFLHHFNKYFKGEQPCN